MNVENSAARDSSSGRKRLASIASSAAASRFDGRSASERLASVVISALRREWLAATLPVVGEQSGDHGDDDETHGRRQQPTQPPVRAPFTLAFGVPRRAAGVDEGPLVLVELFAAFGKRLQDGFQS